jgi:hypothetical protein
MKIILYILLIINVLLFASCKKTKRCQCWKNGVVVEQKMVGSGLDTSTKRNFEIWEELLSLGIMISILQSCVHDAWIVDIRFTGIQGSNDPAVDDLTEKIGFLIIASDGYFSVAVKEIDLFSKCYATTLRADWKNYLDISSFSMTFNKNFIFDSNIIESGTDILEIELIKNDIFIDKESGKLIFYTINFSSELTNKLKFESGEYTVYFSCKTTDGKVFNKSRRVIFKQD